MRRALFCQFITSLTMGVIVLLLTISACVHQSEARNTQVVQSVIGEIIEYIVLEYQWPGLQLYWY